MTTLQLHSERYAATGNLASTGARNQLGRPKLDPLTVLVREAVQNAWDARADERGGVTMRFDLHRPSGEQRQLLRERIFHTRPAAGLALGNVLGDEDILLLCISDRGTIGLGGPTRADVVVPDGQPRDFVDFLRNLGEPPERSLGGGTYGYGKASLYAASRAGCILVHTRTAGDGGLESRFIGAGLGDPFVAGDPPFRHTGRHWWGTIEDGLAEPVRGDGADRIAEALGLPAFSEGARGTSIVVVDLDPGGRSDAETAEHLARALLWNFWPKLVPLADGTWPMRFVVSAEGRDRTVPSPFAHPTLRGYARALEAARARARGVAPTSPDIQVVEIASSQPVRRLGWLALARDIRQVDAGSEADAAAGGLGVPVSSHVAWMRSAELVVQYSPGPPMQTDVVQWGGVFVAAADNAVDAAFSRAEPPTHDDWVVQQLQDAHQKRYVRSALKRIADEVKRWIEPDSGLPPRDGGSPLGAISSELGRILVGLEGPGGGVESAVPEARGPTVVEQTEGEDEPGAPAVPEAPASLPLFPLPDAPAGVPAQRTRPGKPRVRVYEPRLAVEDDIAVLQLDVDVKAGVRTAGTTLVVRTCAVLDSGDGEEAPPAGAAVPRVLRWRSPYGDAIDDPGDTFFVAAANDGRWTLSVQLVDDAAVRVTVDGTGVES